MSATAFIILFVVGALLAGWGLGWLNDGNNKDVFISSFRDPIPTSSLQDRGINGFFEKNAEKPFTGSVYEKYPNEKYKLKAKMENGKPKGKITLWYKNGQKMAEGKIEDGKPDGFMILWYEDGQKLMEANYASGTYDGKNIIYHMNGNKLAEFTFKDGSPVDGSSKVWDYLGREASDKEKMKDEMNAHLARLYVLTPFISKLPPIEW